MACRQIYHLVARAPYWQLWILHANKVAYGFYQVQCDAFVNLAIDLLDIDQNSVVL